MPADNDYKLIMPSNVTYSCLRCGNCCRKWQVAIDGEEAERISSLDWSGVLAGNVFTPSAPGGRPLCQKLPGAERSGENAPGVYSPASDFIRFESSLTHRLSLDDSGACAFLGADNLCAMHVAKGAGFKPHTCLSYPMKFVYLPGGLVQACFSFYCPGVAAGSGAVISPDDAMALVRADHDRVILADRLKLSGDIVIGFDDMTVINDFLSDFLFDRKNASHHFGPGYQRYAPAWDDVGSTLDFEDRLIVAVYFMIIISKMAGKLTRNSPDGFREKFTAEIANRESLVDLLKKCINAKAEAPVKRYTKLFLVSVSHMVMANRPGVTGLGKAARVMTGLLKYLIGMGTTKFPDYGIRTGVRSHSKAVADIHDAQAASLVERYVSHLIFRKRIFYASGMAKGYQHILVYYALVKWFAAALAAGKKNSHADISDFIGAIGLVDREFAYHSAFFENIADNDGFMKILDILFENFSFMKSLLKA